MDQIDYTKQSKNLRATLRIIVWLNHVFAWPIHTSSCLCIVNWLLALPVTFITLRGLVLWFTATLHQIRTWFAVATKAHRASFDRGLVHVVCGNPSDDGWGWALSFPSHIWSVAESYIFETFLFSVFRWISIFVFVLFKKVEVNWVDYGMVLPGATLSTENEPPFSSTAV